MVFHHFTSPICIVYSLGIKFASPICVLPQVLARGKLFRVYAGSVCDKVNNLVGITPLVIVPGNELYKVVV